MTRGHTCRLCQHKETHTCTHKGREREGERGRLYAQGARGKRANRFANAFAHRLLRHKGKAREVL